MKLVANTLSVLVFAFAWAGVGAAQEPAVAIFPTPPPLEKAVSVDLSQVRDELASEIPADPVQIPATVELPASEAAHVCGFTEKELNAMNGPAQCVAQTTSMILDMAVRRDAQLAGGMPAAPNAPSAPQQ
jgi:hypothetical protein